MRRSIKAQSSFLLMIDIQERLMPVIYNKDEVIKNSSRLLKAASELSVPLIVTEQYPKGIGSTLPELKNLIPEGTGIIDKTEFSCCDASGFGLSLIHI